MSDHRYPRRRKRSNVLDGSSFRAPFALGIQLTTNPNRGKMGASPATARVGAFTPNESARMLDGRRQYVPLTVETPLRDSIGRKSRSRSSYTI